MDMQSIIEKKRDGERLSTDEIKYFVENYTEGDIPDYQASALLMAIYFRKLDRKEIYDLTMAMRDSGDKLDLSAIPGIKVDKHSTGGVGDKTTLIAGPLAAACGIPIAKMSGRSLGFTGGTIDKLESIPGYRTSLEESEFFELVNKNGISVIGQTAHIAPADKKIYALRDVTATVDNMGLITASIMSKKLASGSNAIVLDVKCGEGAFMTNEEQAGALAQLMVNLGNDDGVKTMAVITDMNQPLGRCVGNALEVEEAIEVLKGEGAEDITELSLVLAGAMIYAGGKADSPKQGYNAAEAALKNGHGLEKLRDLISGQGGDEGIIDDYSLLPTAKYSEEVRSTCDGFVQNLDARMVGISSRNAGAGRETKEDKIDLSAGISLNAKVGSKVAQGDILAVVFGNDRSKVSMSASRLAKAYTFGPQEPQKPVLIKSIIGE